MSFDDDWPQSAIKGLFQMYINYNNTRKGKMVREGKILNKRVIAFVYHSSRVAIIRIIRD